MDSNPYAAPRDLSPAPPPTEDEELRREYLKHEASVKGVGSLYFIGGVLLLFAAVGMGGTFATLDQGFYMSPVIAVLAMVGLLVFWTAFALRKLKPGGRLAAIVISGLWTIFYAIWAGVILPVGLIGLAIHGYILLILCSSKSTFVCSPRYREIVAATPDIKYRTPLILWILLGLVVFATLAIATFGFTYRG